MDKDYISYLESTVELQALQLDDIRAAGAIVCIRCNLGKLRPQDIHRLASHCRHLSSNGERSFRTWYCEPDLPETHDALEK